jgi:UDP-4-amino-4-deoxy-L-arabinose formyltransferase / UDP-glucuronic acid dehydrogenase (UDP-4-keto-hexauronic acid decarboxylating)
MRVLYFGDPQGARALIAEGVELCGIIHGRRGGVGWLKLLTDLKRQMPSLPRWTRPNLGDPQLISTLKALKPDLIVSGFYPRALPASILALAPGYNVHPSDLPRWRGPDPAYWVIRTGDPHTAICVHELTAELDEGAIVYRQEVRVRPRESGGALATRLERHAALVLATFIASLKAGDQPTSVPQRGTATWAPLVDPDDVEIDWRSSAIEIDRLVRASSPDPGAFTGIGHELVVVYSGVPKVSEIYHKIPIGAPIIEEGECLIRCGDGAFRLGRIKVGRREMYGRDLAKLLT